MAFYKNNIVDRSGGLVAFSGYNMVPQERDERKVRETLRTKNGGPLTRNDVQRGAARERGRRGRKHVDEKC